MNDTWHFVIVKTKPKKYKICQKEFREVIF